MQRRVEATDVLRLRPMANWISSDCREARKVWGGERLRTMRRTIDMKDARTRLAPMVAAFSQSRSTMVSYLFLLLLKRQLSYLGSG